MGDREFELGDAELEVLRVLWENGPLSVREVLKHLQLRGRNLAYTTVQTFLTRLKQKGCVTSRQDGLAHIFKATVSRDRVTRSKLGSLLDALFDGAAGPLAVHLIKNERFTPQEIAQLQQLIDQMDPKGKRPAR